MAGTVALPAWFARGSAVGEIPRRSLAVVSVLDLAVLAGLSLFELDLEVSVLATTGSFSLVYVVGTAAGVRLLPRGTWAHRAAVIALFAVLVLLGLTGVYVVWALAVAGAALAYDAYADVRPVATWAR